MESNICLKLLITSILLTISCSAQQDSDTTGTAAEIDQKWNDFKGKFGKSYGSATEESMRKRIFIGNLEKIQAHNKLYTNGLKSYFVGINQFHDMTQSEFVGMTTCAPIGPAYYTENFTISEDISRRFKKEVDWRKEGYVTRVKDQGQCGPCWAFASTGALEGQNFRKTGRLVSLSEQNLVDCTTNYVNNGCKGGIPGRTFVYVSDNGGMNSEASYPYEDKSGTCRYQPNDVAATCDGLTVVRGEIKLQAAVADVGPVVAAMHVSQSFSSYKGGIFDDENCNNGTIGHTMLVVGYGTDSLTKKDYWIIKNSWGTTWGIDGYALIVRNKRMCRIGYYSAYPNMFKDQILGDELRDE